MSDPTSQDSGPLGYSVVSRAARRLQPVPAPDDAFVAPAPGWADREQPVTSAAEQIRPARERETPHSQNQTEAQQQPQAQQPVIPSLPITLPPPASRDTGTADPGIMTTTDRPERAQRGLRGVLGTLGIRLTPGQAEQAEREAILRLRSDEALIRQSTWTRAVSILVANRKGGVGKTPVSLMLAGTLAAIRGGSVCVLEVSDDPGALTFRAEGSPNLGLGELVPALATITSAGQLAGYTAPQTSFASVIGSIGERARLSGSDVVALSALIDAYYSIRVMDSGNQTSSSAFRGAIESADALVVPVLNSGDAVLEALSLLDTLRAQGPAGEKLAAQAIILRLTDGRPEHPQVLERIDRLIAGSGVAKVFALPFDSHIAERGQLTLSKLSQASYRVFAAAGAQIVSTLRV